MKIPSVIKIGGVDFTVIVNDDYKEEDANVRTMGQMDYFKGQIWIRESIGDNMKESVLLHEILEAINEAHELNLKHSQITSLEHALYQVIKDNNIVFNGTGNNNTAK